MHYHLVLVVKYRRQVFDGDISNYEKDIFVRIGQSYNVMLEDWNHDKDHVHTMFQAHPNRELSKFLNTYKSVSSRLIKRDFSIVRQKLWKELFRSRSFCLITTGGASIEAGKQYIEK
ncbi:hypothetical protein IIU_06063 [Bacillus cereus VD133]|uniref:Transposase IS200-like domain-containing protein n=1 Tax=Bacillus cereus VD133 TaxID=1053233 RepID=A0A9W5PL40_BACCE|nr:hypothetical protein IIU_06063 [Bacillus cereus VD133]